jgi:GrpB-like predicted nucleotidyltransferase (UPF0157 family)
MSTPVVIVPYRESWRTDFSLLAASLRAALGPLALRVEHVGSTAVPGMAAKDVVDIQVSVASLEGRIEDLLGGAGFRLHDSISSDHLPPGAQTSPEQWTKLFFVEPAGQRRANVHIRVAGRLNERFALLCRDYLRAWPNMAGAYSELKRRLSVSLAVPDDYADVKDPAVDLIYLAAEQWAVGCGWELPATLGGSGEA